MKVKSIIKILILGLFLFSCEYLKKDYNLKEEITLYPEIRMIYLENDIDILIVQDTIDFIKIISPDNLINGVKQVVKGDTITLLNENRSQIIDRYGYKITAEVHSKNLYYVYFKGSGTVESKDTLKMDSFQVTTMNATGNINLKFKGNYLRLVHSTGAVDVHISGSVNTLSVWTATYGRVDLSNFIAKRVTVTNISTNDIFVYASEYLEAMIEYTGNIYYYGKPGEIKIEKKGSGEVIMLK